nr:l-type lectin-domain containing receptor kinase ix.1 [Quercus suber]
MITNFFTLLTPFTFTSALSFNFTSFSKDNTDITYESTANSENQTIQLTGSKLTEWLQGRATYSKPLQLRDNATGKLTDFTTHFTFSISSLNQTAYGDGMTFFIVPNGSKIPTLAIGGALGLYEIFNTSNNRFVAVEFDIFTNDWDPPGEHPQQEVLMLYILFILGILVQTYKSDNNNVEEFPRGRAPRKFSYDELARATNNFNDEQILGRGGFGVVYRGYLMDSNSSVAVKKISEESRQGVNEFASEINVISRLRHRNLVELIGWCHERRRELLLVYDFMPNGSLDSHLYGEGILLTWERRYKIVRNLASALLYLHEGWEHCVLHRDIKPSNIMLDSNFNAKLGDFGLARLVDHAIGSRTTRSAGTWGYMDPTCVTRASKKSDAYSFGMVTLEIATGRRPIDQSVPQDLLPWVQELHKRGEVLGAADQRLGGSFDEQEMECLLIVGLWCCHSDHDRRPHSMLRAIQVLNLDVPLPDLLPLGTSRSTESETTTSNGATSSMG